MRWFKPNLKSIYSLLGQTAPSPEPAAAFRTEAVRQMMLDTMTTIGLEATYPHIFSRIFHAVDAQTLWYARSELMTALASEWGETFAREKIAAISGAFEGLLPEGFRYQPRVGPDRVADANPAKRAGPRRR